MREDYLPVRLINLGVITKAPGLFLELVKCIVHYLAKANAL